MVERIAAPEELENLLASETRLVLLEFVSPGCAACLRLQPHVEALAREEGPGCRVVEVDVSRVADLALRYGVTRTPTFVFVKSGQEVTRYRAAAPLAGGRRRAVEPAYGAQSGTSTSVARQQYQAAIERQGR